MTADNERLHILAMLEQGQITAEQALGLIQALGDGEADGLFPAMPVLPASAVPEAADSEAHRTSTSATETPVMPAAEVFAPEPEDPPGEAGATPSDKQEADILGKRFRNLWLIPLWIGAAITVLGGLLMYAAWQASGFGFWFACAWFPFTLGVLVLICSWLARGMPWLHLRIHQPAGEGPRNIVISFPLPLRLAGWGLRTFRQRIPGLEHSNVDEIIVALENISPETPFSLEVNEGDGEQVEIYIG